MLQRHCWRQLLLCVVLQLATLMGAPLRPKDIEDSLRPASELTLQQQCRNDKDEPDPTRR